MAPVRTGTKQLEPARPALLTVLTNQWSVVAGLFVPMAGTNLRRAKLDGLFDIPLAGSGLVAKINADDYERPLFVEFSDGFVWNGRICERAWKPHHKPHTTYAVCLLQTDGKVRELRLHRLVLCARAGDIIDHEDRNGLHNWRTNLRFTNDQGNGANRSAMAGTSRFKGVALHRQTGKYEACIRIARKKKHLGLHVTEESAARAYDEAALEAFGSMALLNFPEVPA